MSKWFRRNKRIIGMVVAILLAILLTIPPLLGGVAALW